MATAREDWCKGQRCAGCAGEEAQNTSLFMVQALAAVMLEALQLDVLLH